MMDNNTVDLSQYQAKRAEAENTARNKLEMAYLLSVTCGLNTAYEIGEVALMAEENKEYLKLFKENLYLYKKFFDVLSNDWTVKLLCSLDREELEENEDPKSDFSVDFLSKELDKTVMVYSCCHRHRDDDLPINKVVKNISRAGADMDYSYPRTNIRFDVKVRDEIETKDIPFHPRVIVRLLDSIFDHATLSTKGVRVLSSEADNVFGLAYFTVTNNYLTEVLYYLDTSIYDVTIVEI